MKTPFHKIELYVGELNNQFGIDEIKVIISNALRDYLVHFGEIDTKDAGEWSDDHKLNKTNADCSTIFKELK